MTWLRLTCPLCGHLVSEADGRTVGMVRGRCYNRRCAMPVVTYRIEDGRATRLALVDRRERRRVS